MGRLLAVLLSTALLAAGCSGDDGSKEEAAVPDRAAEAGFADAAWFEGRQDEYLTYATEELDPASMTNVIAHAERVTRDDGYEWDAAAVTPDALGPVLERIAGWVDTTDFDVLYLLNLWYGYRDQLPEDTVAAIEEAFLGFEYWYTEPTPEDVVDDKYYWSENHRIIFHVDEYLAGQAFPEATFANDGRTGAEHRDEARQRILEWIDEKARFGFTEWHSDVYYQKDVTPLLSLVEWAEDEELSRRAAMALDLVLFDLALHLHRGNMGATHGRSYMKDKSIAPDQNVFDLAKLLFDDTDLPFDSPSDPGAVLLARAERFMLPEVLRRVATSDQPLVDRERMGVPLDALAPVTADPEAPYGYDFDDPANVPFWWERGAQTAWQVVPTTLETLERYDLWESQFFAPFKPLADPFVGNPEGAQTAAQSLAPLLSFALLSQADTYTYRTVETMLSSVLDHRPGTFADQIHAWQATLDEEAIVFTTHPKNEPFDGTEGYEDDDGYWTGSGSMPRSAQVENVGIHLYAPVFAPPGDGPLGAFDYLNYTHAYFPTQRFDEVVRAGQWTLGRKGEAYVALWSWRPVDWREHDPDATFTNGLTEVHDLVAAGGADNAWVVEVGDVNTAGSFEEFQEAISGSAIEAVPRPMTEAGLAGGFDVVFESPSRGRIAFGSVGPLTVDGQEVSLGQDLRYDNPWAQVPFDSRNYEIADAEGSLLLDFEAGTRRAT